MKTSSALVFDIKRFAVHDGDGIRTTVFFKGCPLRCKWCQNPEGLSSKRMLVYFENKCIHCKICEKAGEGKITYTSRPVFDQSIEDYDQAVRFCPANALQYDSLEYTIDELFSKIKEDEVFFKYGGGVTFSGGEPFVQGDFLIDILKKCHGQGIHTAIESSFFTSLDLVKRAVPYLDRIYADLKVFDHSLHKQFTGVDNTRILENIKYLLTSEHKDKVIIRTPLIPGYTASYENIRAISEYIVNLYPEVKYEILNYNPLASSKYELIQDVEYGVESKYKIYKQDVMETYYSIAKDAGVKNIIIE